jgi:hypothetical protein
VAFNLNYPIVFPYLDYLFYANTLVPTTSATGQLPIPTGASSNCQPYPWDVNLTLQLQNGQLYNMEQQLVIGYAPEVNSAQYDTPVDYLETNSLLTVTLYCTNNGAPYILPVSRFILTATLLPYNIPAPLDLTAGWSFTPDFYTNWAWPLTSTDLIEPSSPLNSPGAAGTVQASLDSLPGNTTVDHTNLLVRADREYQLALAY